MGKSFLKKPEERIREENSYGLQHSIQSQYRKKTEKYQARRKTKTEHLKRGYLNLALEGH